MKNQIEFTSEQIALIKSQIAPKATNEELQLFLYQAKRTGLDPLARQIYCIHRKSDGKEKMVIQTSIDGFRVIAERTGDYGGQNAPIFEEFNAMPTKCTVSVFRFRGDTRYEASVGVAYFSEYAQMKDEWINGQKTGKKLLGDMWAKMPHTMLAKVAEALALRKAYPQDLSGLYTTDEMAQSENEAVETGVPQQLEPATSIPFTPYAQTYTDTNALMAVVKSAVKIEELTQLYMSNQSLVDGNTTVKDAMAAKRDAIKNQGKVIITSNQFMQVCDRLRKGDETVYQNAINIYLLNLAQIEELEHIVKENRQLEDALALKYNNANDLLNIINMCRNEGQLLKFHKNNSMIIDRDAELKTRINAKLKEVKAAA